MGFFKSAAKASLASAVLNRVLNRGGRRRSAWGRAAPVSSFPFAYGRNAAIGGLAMYALNKYRQSRANASMKTPVHP